MADNETTENLIAWLRMPREGENAYLTEWRNEIADRLEAAMKRERAKLREALANLVDVIDRCASNSPLWWHNGAKE